MPEEQTADTAPATKDTIRDHLANERTYLAWLRSGVALLGLGFVAARLRIDLGEVGVPPPPPGLLRGAVVGLGFAVFGIATIIFGTWRYQAVRRMIQRAEFTPMGMGLVAFSAGALVVAAIVILYLLERLMTTPGH